MDKLGTTKIARNSAASVLRFIASVPVPFLLVPFMLQALGAERFGIWALVSTLSAFVQLGDFGIGLALVKSVAQLRAANNLPKLNRILSTALVLYAVFAGGIGLCGLLTVDLMVKQIFHIPLLLVSEAEFVIVGTLLIFCTNLALSIFASIINGIQRMDVFNGIAFATTILNALGVVLVLSLRLGLRGLVINNGITTLGASLACLLAVRKLAPGIHFGPREFCWPEVKSILTYGVNIQITSLAGLAGDPLVKAIISNVAGLQFVAFYDIAVRLMGPLRALFSQAISPLMPFAAESHATADWETLMAVYRKSVRYIVLVALPLFALIAVMAPALIQAWVGPGNEISAYTLQILLVGSLISTISMPSYYVFLSTNVRVVMILAIANGLLDILVCIPLGYLYGYWAVIIGFSLVMGGLATVGLVIFCRLFQVGFWSLFADVPLRGILFSIGLVGLLWGILSLWPQPGLFVLVFAVLIFAAVYGMFLWFSKSISRNELLYLMRALNLARA